MKEQVCDRLCSLSLSVNAEVKTDCTSKMIQAEENQSHTQTPGTTGKNCYGLWKIHDLVIIKVSFLWIVEERRKGIILLDDRKQHLDKCPLHKINNY